ncbi:MAG: hypothetical protein MUC87_02725 [Bacteroidia bacterium]|nr:hypothetical protein [Bacteroidia bacterium]
MKKLLPCLSALVFIIQGCSDNPKSDTIFGGATLSYSISQTDEFPNLPPLQSFVFGQTTDAWLFIGGRTNGFHGFPNDGNLAFPRKKANKWIYAYTLSTHSLDSISVDSLPVALKDQFSFTNIQHTQDGDSLYLCGGYGATFTSPNDSTFITDSTFSRVIVSQMVAAVKSHSGAQLRSSVVYAAPDNFVCATGGEMFKINGRFYLCVGQRYQGGYNAGTPPPGLQTYLDAVHSFTITQTASSISLNTASYQTITDGLPDSTTQFRRRDLVVSPGIQTNEMPGISIYGGVFTFGPGYPFTHPIYITVNGQNATYAVDTSHQYSNNYAAANLGLYSKTSKKMYTTIFGGIVENAADTSQASFTKKVMTISRDLQTNTTTYTTDAALMTASDNKYYGAESDFILAPNAPLYNATYGIVDFDALPANQPLVIGYVFGGIIASAPDNNGQSNSSASNKVFKVTVTRNVAGTPPTK